MASIRGTVEGFRAPGDGNLHFVLHGDRTVYLVKGDQPSAPFFLSVLVGAFVSNRPVWFEAAAPDTEKYRWISELYAGRWP